MTTTTPTNTVEFDVWNDPTFAAGYEDWVADEDWDALAEGEFAAVQAELGIKAA